MFAERGRAVLAPPYKVRSPPSPHLPTHTHISMGGRGQFRSALREGVPESLRGIFEWEMPLDSEEEPQPRL